MQNTNGNIYGEKVVLEGAFHVPFYSLTQWRVFLQFSCSLSFSLWDVV